MSFKEFSDFIIKMYGNLYTSEHIDSVLPRMYSYMFPEKAKLMNIKKMKKQQIKDFGGVCLWCEEKTALKNSCGDYTNTCGDCMIKSYEKTSPQDVVWVKWGIKNGVNGGHCNYSDWLTAGSPRD